MEREEVPKTLCRSGCGFYGSSATDGLCSVCFKEVLKKKCVPTQASSSSSSSSSSSASAGSASGASPNPGTPNEQPVVITTTSASLAATINVGGEQSTSSSAAASVTASAIIDVVSQSSPSPSTAQSPEEDDKKPSKPKNRCDTCKKKVGLTGFDCRCGGLFCSLHRYSDKHECNYNYREQGAAEIRRNNPQIMGQKINKI